MKEIAGRDGPIDVWVVEDETTYRNTLKYVLDHTTGLKCGFAFGDYEALIRHLDDQRQTRSMLRGPSVLLLDINLPGISGLSGIREIKERLPDTQILMLTVRDDAKSIYESLRCGASGYLQKNVSVDDIVTAVRQASMGGLLMPAPVAREVLSFFRDKAVADYGLTPREREVLAMMATGLSQKQIADHLNSSPHTVNTHMKHIYSKLHVHSGIEAVVKAFRDRLV